MKPKRTNPLFANFFRANTLVAAAVVSLGAAALPNAFAGTLYWDTNAATAGSGNAAGAWNSGTNWSTDSTGASATVGWTDGESAVFSAGTDGTGAWAATITGTITTPSILVEETGAKTITGGTINIGGGSINTSAAGTGNAFTISSALAGSGGLTVAGNGDLSDTGGGAAGMLVLSGANTFTGNMTITSGLVRLDSNFGDSANKIVLNGGGILDNNLNVTSTRNIEVGASGGILRLWGSATTNLNGSISNASGVLSANLKHTDGGTLRLGGSGAGFTGTFTNARGNIQLASTNWSGMDLVNTDGSTFTVVSTGDTSIKSLSSDRDVSIPSGGRLNITSGNYTAAAGAAVNNFWMQGSGKLTSSSGTLTLDWPTSYVTASDQSVRVILEDYNVGTPLAVVKNGPGGVNNFDKANTYTGGTTINGGRITSFNTAAFGTGAVTVNSGGQAYFAFSGTSANNFVINGNGSTETAGQLGAIRFGGNTLSGSINVASASRISAYSSTGTHSGALTGSAALGIGVTGNAGTMNFTGNTGGYTGAMTLNAGTLNVGATGLGGSLTVATGTANVTGSVGSDVVVGGATVNAVNSTVSSTGGVTTIGGSITGNLTVNGGSATADGATAVATATGGTATVSGNISGNLLVNSGTETELNGALAINTTATGGTVTLGSSTTVGGNATVNDGATIKGEGAVTGSLNLGSTSGATLRVNANTAGALSAGTVNLTGTNFVYLDVLPSTAGPFTVLSYTTLGSGDETNFQVQPAGAYRGDPQVQHDIVNQKFTLELDSQTRTWNNAALTGNWNTTDLNWVEGDNLFFNGDDVAFTDTAVGTVNLGSNLQPLSITLSNTVGNNYTFTGGSIVGTTGLTMGGGGNLTLGGTNTYTGAVAVNAGVLTLNSQQGFGQTSGVSIASGARVNLNGQTPGALAGAGYGYTFTIAGDGGDGAGGVGALTNSGGDTYGNSGVKSLVLSGNAEIGGSNGRFDVGSHAGAGVSGTINGGGFTLTKVGTNQMVFRGAATNITYVVNAGTVNFEDTDAASGTNKITVNNTAVMGTYGARTLPNEVDLNTGTTLSNLGGGTGTWTGTVNVLGNATFSVGGGNLVIDGALAGSGTITRTGANTLVLQNSGASYSGKIANNGGTLRVESASATGTYAGADAITMAAGTTLQGGTITAQASATVGTATTGITQTGDVTYDAGTGNTLTIAGNVTGTGNITKPNNTGALSYQGVSTTGKLTANGGTLTINGNLTLGTTLEVGGGIVNNLNSPTVSIGGAGTEGFKAWVGTTNINIGTGTFADLELGNGTSQHHTVNHTAGALTVNKDFRIGHWGGGTSVYNISGGSVSMPDTVTNATDEAQANLFIGIDGTGNLNISGTGVINTTSLVVNGRGGTTSDTLNLTGGRLNIGKWGIRNPGTAIVNLGGGTVGAFGSNWSSSTPMNLTGTGGNVTVDTLDSVDLTTGRTITLSGALSGAGGLTKAGAGTLVLTGGGSAGGTLTATGGTLHLGTTAWTAATVASSAGGAIQPGNLATAGAVSIPTLTLNGGSPTFRANYNGGAYGDRFLVTGSNAFTVASPTVLTVIPGSDLFVGDKIPIIDYSGTIGGASGFAGLSATAAGNPHYALSLEDDTTNTVVNVVIDSLDSIVWKGNVNGVWDVNSTSNWETVSVPSTSKFYDLDAVKFTDDVGAGATTVTLTGTIKPSSVLVDATVNYTLQGTGLTGGTGLTKTNTGSLTLLNTNSNTGAVAITGGTVTVGNGGTAGTLGGSGNITLSSATLELNRSDAQTLDRTVAGSAGTLVKNGSNTLTMSAANNTCDITINNGTLAARGGNWSTSFAANRTITINGGGTLDTTTHSLNGLGGGARPAAIVINEDGIWKLNAEQYLPANTNMTAGIINGPGEIRGGGNVNVAAHATKSSVINSPVNLVGTINFNVSDGAVATDLSVTGNIGGGAAVTKTGAGVMVPSGTNTYTGGTNANGGTLTIATIADAGGVGGMGTGYLGIANDGTFQYTGTGAETTARALWIDTGAQVKTIEVTSPTGDITFTSTAGNINKPFKKTGAGSLTIADVMNAGTAVTVDGGKLTLGGTNAYTGDTTVNAGGTLVVDGDSIADGGALKINGSGKVEVTEPVDPTAEVVDTLWINGTQMAAGTYGATGSGATNIDNTHFAGAGVVQVTTGPIGYDSWASGYGLVGGDALRGSDPDGDSFTNLQEFLFGTDPTANTGSLTTTTQAGSILTIRWSQRTSGATYLLKESATLANDWTTWGGTPATDGAVSGDYQPMKADVTIGAGKDFFRVEGVEN